MSKKKERGRRVGLCLGCGAALRKRDKRCKECGRASRLFQGKAARAPLFVTKGGNVTPILAAKSARPVCHCGHQGRRTHKHCTTCGLPYGISKMAVEGVALKASGVVPTGYWAAQAAGESDPQQRELMRSYAAKNTGRQSDAEALARAWGFPDLRTAAMYCTAPEARSYFVSQYYGNGGVA